MAAALSAAALRRQHDRYLRHLEIERGLSPNSVAAYRRDLRGFLEALETRGVTDADALDADTVRGYVVSLRHREVPLAASSTARVISSIRGFMRFLVEEGVLQADPAESLIAPKLPKRLPKALTQGQVEALLAATDGDDPVRLRDKALLELLYATGARVSEAVTLDVDDLVGAEGTPELIRVIGKGDKQRIVPLGSFARAAIEAYLVRARPLLVAGAPFTSKVFVGARGAPLRMARRRPGPAHPGIDYRARRGVPQRVPRSDRDRRRPGLHLPRPERRGHRGLARPRRREHDRDHGLVGGADRTARQLEALGFLQLTLAIGKTIGFTGGFALIT